MKTSTIELKDLKTGDTVIIDGATIKEIEVALRFYKKEKVRQSAKTLKKYYEKKNTPAVEVCENQVLE